LIRKPQPAQPVLSKKTTPGTPEANVMGVTLAATPAEADVSVSHAAMTPQQRQRMGQRNQAKAETAQDVAAAGLTPEQDATLQARAESAGMKEKIEGTMRLADQLGIKLTQEDRNLLFETALGVRASSLAGKWQTRAGTLNGQKATLMYNEKDGRWTYLDGSSVPSEILQQFIPDAAKPIRKVKMGVAPSKQSDTGYIELWGDPSHPGDKSLWEWTPIGATRYQQVIHSESSQVDPFGVITKTIRDTGPKGGAFLDVTGVTRSEGYNTQGALGATAAPSGPAVSPGAAPPATPHPAVTPMQTPQHIKAGIPSVPVVTNPSAAVGSYSNPLPLDSSGHVPESAPMNPLTKANVNRLLDGADIDKLGLRGADRSAVEKAAQQYGWQQGLFTPKDKLLIREAGTFLKSMRGAPSLNVLGSYTSRAKIHNAIKAADDKGGFFSDQIALIWGLTNDEQDFVQRFLQTRGTVSGLSQLVRGGRTTEAGIKRLQSELPDPLTVHSAKDAQMRLDRLLSEIDVAQKQGFVSEVDGGSENLVDKIDKLIGPQPTTVYDKDGIPHRYKGTGHKSDPNNYEKVPNAAPNQ